MTITKGELGPSSRERCPRTLRHLGNQYSDTSTMSASIQPSHLVGQLGPGLPVWHFSGFETAIHSWGLVDGSLAVENRHINPYKLLMNRDRITNCSLGTFSSSLRLPSLAGFAHWFEMEKRGWLFFLLSNCQVGKEKKKHHDCFCFVFCLLPLHCPFSIHSSESEIHSAVKSQRS